MNDKLKQFFLSNAGLWLIFILWALFCSNFWLPRNWGFYGTDDWDLTYSTFEVARKSIVEYGQWPSFNPYCAFGSDLDANPQATHISIFFIPVLLFGTFYGYKISILLAMLLGAWGAFKLFEILSKDRLIAVCMSLIFCGSAYFSRHIFEAGHSNVLYLYLLPWLVYFLEKLRHDYQFKNFLWPILILCQIIIGGAPFIFIICSLLMLLWSIGMIWIEKTGWKPVRFFLGVILFSLALSSIKIWPVLQFWNQMPRLVKDESGINLLIWLQALCDLKTDTRTPHEWHEFAMGFSLVLLAFTIYYFKQILNGKKWLFLFAFVLWLSIGNTPSYVNPWYLLNHYVPIFTSLRAPYRFGILTVFILSIAFIKSTSKIEYKQLIYILLISITLTQTLSYNSISKKFIGSKYIEQFNAPNQEIIPIKKTYLEDKSQFLLIRQNYLVQNAYEPLFLSPANDTMTNFVQGAQLLSFSPQKIKLLSHDSDVYLNIRYSANWHLTGKGELYDQKGLIGIKNSTDTIELQYDNPNFKIGLLSTAFSALILCLFSFFIFRSKKLV